VRFSKLALLVAVGLLLGPAPAGAQKVDEGFAYLRRDTTWTKADSPVRIEGIVVVDDGVTLTIEPGVTTELIGLHVQGGLVAEGTPAEPVVFSGYRRRWDGIRMEDVDGDLPERTIGHATIENASWGLTMGHDAFPVTDVLFSGNRVGLLVTNPTASVSFTGNRFYSNDIGFDATATGFVGVYSNDFWDNDVSLLFEAQGPYACNKEPGTFDVRYNDILRGPDDPWYSFDVRTSDDSAGRGMVVRAPDNWWGTTDRGDIRARMRERVNCCPGPDRAPIEWREPADEPQTVAEPPGAVENPSQPPDLHGDPAYIVEVRRPKDAECVANGSLQRIRGVAYEALAAAPDEVTVRLVRRHRYGCDSYDPTTGRFSRPHSCGDPFTFEIPVRDRRWILKLRRPLRPGRYTFAAEGEIVRFRVLRD
jgi:hypothetical protein